jgi:hypothetical protein
VRSAPSNRLMGLHNSALARRLLDDEGGALRASIAHGMWMFAPRKHSTGSQMARDAAAPPRDPMTHRARAGWLAAALLAFGLGVYLGAAWHQTDARERNPGSARPVAASAFA